MKNKYVMPRFQNVAFIKSNLETYLNHCMVLARYNANELNQYPEGSEEKTAYENFKAGFESILSKDTEANYDYLIQLHAILMHGLFDEINQQLPQEQIDELNRMINQPAKANTEIAIDVLFYILDGRLFKDGDVRVAIMFANKIMLEGGCGVISIDPENKDTFRKMLKEYHITHTDEFKNWIYRTSIRGKKYDY